MLEFIYNWWLLFFGLSMLIWFILFRGKRFRASIVPGIIAVVFAILGLSVGVRWEVTCEYQQCRKQHGLYHKKEEALYQFERQGGVIKDGQHFCNESCFQRKKE